MPMNTFSNEHPNKSVDKQTAWTCTLANLLVAPGLGSIAAGLRIGYVQLAIAVIGLILSVIGVVGVVRDWSGEGGFAGGMPAAFWVASSGFALFLVAWLWALLISVRLHREANRSRTAQLSGN